MTTLFRNVSAIDVCAVGYKEMKGGLTGLASEVCLVGPQTIKLENLVGLVRSTTRLDEMVPYTVGSMVQLHWQQNLGGVCCCQECVSMCMNC